MHSSVTLTSLTDLCHHLHSQFCNGLTLQKNHIPPIFLIPSSAYGLCADGLCDCVCLLWTFYCVTVWPSPLSVTLMLYSTVGRIDTPFLFPLADSLLLSPATVHFSGA